jgi:hypothetical protein
MPWSSWAKNWFSESLPVLASQVAAGLMFFNFDGDGFRLVGTTTFWFLGADPAFFGAACCFLGILGAGPALSSDSGAFRLGAGRAARGKRSG